MSAAAVDSPVPVVVSVPAPAPKPVRHEEECIQLIHDDKLLSPFLGALKYRYHRYKETKRKIEDYEGGLEKFSRGYERFGFNRKEGGVEYREWAPGARALYVFGDFNNWNRSSHPCTRDNFGVWSTFIADHPDGTPGIRHNSKVKIQVHLPSGEHADRIPAWIRRAVQEGSVLFDGVYWDPPQKYVWKNPRPSRPKNLRIYESHVGMATKDCRVGFYTEFRDYVLPRVKNLGYTAVQIMAIMEHAYYASFGYHVTNFFAVSSRCGTPDELKSLIDKAHELGLVVLMDIVHSHASTNVLDGLNYFDGTDHQYFHEGHRGKHPLWDSRLFNYGHWEVLRFLLSNLRFYMEEYKFDGFRFDGVTSMMYTHHGIAYGFSGGYHEYFNDSVDIDCMVYLMLANDMLHSLYPDCITIAEDVSGMPTLARPVEEGGVGFDFRLAMAVPDVWIKLLKEVSDDAWNMGHIAHTLTNRRWKENTIAYAESHDQALVGDKTMAFWLMDKEMYDYMGEHSPMTMVIERGLALHKMLRALTMALGGEGYLTFMGNEFGHPEWIDFPRDGNGNSYHHARRRWDLAENPSLRYKYLERFEQGIMDLDEAFSFMRSDHYVSLTHEIDKMIVFQHMRSKLVWVFNLHPTNSVTNYRIGVPWAGTYRIVLDSDDRLFAGQGRNNINTRFHTKGEHWQNRPNFIQVYSPARTMLCFCLEEDWVPICDRLRGPAGLPLLKDLYKK
mmetsp:Transcript_8804/g.15174  ORF Transcript_8804/g.15174 Transcript_8804/m.15174 type:complete len:725 (+) Transcript_8804:121-2295(+)